MLDKVTRKSRKSTSAAKDQATPRPRLRSSAGIQAGVDAKDKGHRRRSRSRAARRAQISRAAVPKQHHPKPGRNRSSRRRLRRALLPRLEEARRQGRADHRRRFRHRPRSRGAFCARGRLRFLSHRGQDAETTRKAVEAEGRLHHDLGDVVGTRSLHESRQAHGEGIRQARHAGQQRGFQIHSQIRGSDARTFRHDAEDQSLRLFPHGAGCGPAHEAGSAIINTGSVTGIEGSKELVDYSMTKGGIHAFTRALSGNLLSRGIRVNASRQVRSGRRSIRPRRRRRMSQFGAKTPMKRPPSRRRSRRLTCFCSPHCSSYITGEILPIVGGY